jgi:nitrogenase molybdenum-cofactor synthesis protein NifE
MSFSTDLQEMDVIYGGAGKLEASLLELIRTYQPKAAFVYSTCIAGLIGDDIEAICRKVSKETGLTVLPVHSEGFRGTKKDGYKAACEALFKLVGTLPPETTHSRRVNLLGEFNIGGETWVLKEYFKKMDVEVTATLTGDGRVDDIRRSHGAQLNLVQCSGSMLPLAKMYEKEYGIPYKQVSYFGLEDTAEALYETARFFGGEDLMERTRNLVREETGKVLPRLKSYREKLKGRKAAVYVGGGFKAFSLVRALRLLGMGTVLVGTQTGSPEDYEKLRELCDPGTVVVDDTNPVELSAFLSSEKVDLLVGGVKERPIAYKLGIGFCDHNHERKIALAGFEGMLNFAREVHSTVSSPVWRWTARGRRPLP